MALQKNFEGPVLLLSIIVPATFEEIPVAFSALLEIGNARLARTEAYLIEVSASGTSVTMHLAPSRVVTTKQIKWEMKVRSSRSVDPCKARGSPDKLFRPD